MGGLARPLHFRRQRGKSLCSRTGCFLVKKLVEAKREMLLKEKGKRLSALLLSLALLAAPMTQAVFAEGEGDDTPGAAYTVTYHYGGSVQAIKDVMPEDDQTYEEGATVTVKQPTSTTVRDGNATYTFEGWEKDGEKLTGSSFIMGNANVTLEADWSDPVYPANLTGTVCQYAFSASESSGSPKSGVEVVISLKSGTTTVTSDSNGKFSYTFEDDSLRTEDGKYSWSIAKDDEHYAASGTLEEGTEDEPKDNKLYIRERYNPQSADYKFAESENVKKVGNATWVKEAGTYTIEGASGKQLAKILDGTPSDSIDISVSSDGSMESFFVFVGGLCSKILIGQSVNVDSGAPVVGSVSTEAANDNTYVKEHGVYGKEKAELILTADITEDSRIKEVYLFSTAGEETRRYDATAISGSSNKYSVEIPLPDEETIMDAQLVKLVAVDIFGKRSNEVLIAQSEEGSSVTLEQIAPTIKKSVSGTKSSYGWYSALPTLTAKVTDGLSGLESVKIEGEGSTIAEESYSGKENGEKTVSGKASFEDESSNGSYEYTVEAKDNSGNVGTATFNVKIDLTKPSVSATGVESGEYYRSNPSIRITEDEKYYTESGNRIFVKVTRDGASVLDKTYNKVNSVSVPSDTFAKDGVYSVTIYAMDAADNKSNTLTYKFTKDATSPKVTISGVKEGKFYNKRQTVTVSVEEFNYSTDNVTVSAIKKLGGSTKNMGFPWKNTAVVSENSKTFSETGTYTITATAVDKAGNQGGPKKVSFTIDTKPPVITIKGVRDGGIYTYGQGLAPSATVTDDYLASKSIIFTKGGEVISNPDFDQIKENDGLYTMTVTASDKAGNTARKQISFTVNRFGSYFEYNDAIKVLQGKAVQNVDSNLVITERNISKVIESKAAIYKDGKLLDIGGTTQKNEDGAEKVYRHTFVAGSFEPEGAYEINVISKDEVGNEMESKAENGVIKFFVDRTEPELSLSGIDPKGNKAESITVTINVSDLLTGVSEVNAYVDGETMFVKENDDKTLTFIVGEGLRQEVKVTAVDGAGNKAEVTETASVSTNAASLFLNRFLIPVCAAAAALAGLLVWIITKKRRQDDDEEESEE